MIDIIGWIAGIMFALCGLPQALQSYRQGNSNGVNLLFLYMWLCGEVLMQFYIIIKHGWDMPLLVNYWVNTVLVVVVLKYKHFPRG